MEEARGEENGSGIERESWVRKCSFLLQCISRHFSWRQAMSEYVCMFNANRHAKMVWVTHTVYLCTQCDRQEVHMQTFLDDRMNGWGVHVILKWMTRMSEKEQPGKTTAFLPLNHFLLFVLTPLSVFDTHMPWKWKRGYTNITKNVIFFLVKEIDKNLQSICILALLVETTQGCADTKAGQILFPEFLLMMAI